MYNVKTLRSLLSALIDSKVTLWVRLSFEEINYYHVIVALAQRKCRVEFRHSTHNVSKIGQKVGTKYFTLTLHYVEYSLKSHEVES